MLSRFIDWLSAEPAAVFLLIAAAAGVFVTHFQAAKTKAWDRRVLEAAARAVLLLALVLAFRQALNDGSDAFQITHEGTAGLNSRNAYALWGEPIQQRELEVFQLREVEIKDQIPREDPNQPPEFRTVKMEQEVRQNVITGFRGDIRLRLGERETGGARYSGYTADVTLDYEIRSQADSEAEMIFNLMLDNAGQTYENIQIEMDGRAVTPERLDYPVGVVWKARMQPGQTSAIHVVYSATGSDSFVYQIRNDHLINNGLLMLTVDRLPVDRLVYPLRGLAPNEVRPSDDGRGAVLTWKLDRAAATAWMGIDLPDAEQRGAQVLRALLPSPEMVCLLGGLLAVSMLLWQRRLSFPDLVLFLALFSLEFLVLAAASDLLFGFWGGLAAGLVPVLFLAWRWTRGSPAGALRWLLLIIFALFAVLAPLSSLWVQAEQQNAFQMYLQAGLVLYLTGLWLVSRRKPAPTPEAG